MYRPRIIPVLLLHNGGLYKTRQFTDPVYVGDPINAVKIFNDAEADELIFLDIDNKEFPDYNIIEKISEETMMPFSYGGNIHSSEAAKKVFDCGAEKVVINTACYHNSFVLSDIASIYGNQSVIVSIDVKEENGSFFCYSSKGRTRENIDPVSHAKICVDAGAGEVMINSIDRDGSMSGYDLELISKVASAVDVPVIACGGASCYEDFRAAVLNAGASAASAGSLFVFMGGRRSVMINYPEQEELTELFNN